MQLKKILVFCPICEKRFYTTYYSGKKSFKHCGYSHNLADFVLYPKNFKEILENQKSENLPDNTYEKEKMEELEGKKEKIKQEETEIQKFTLS